MIRSTPGADSPMGEIDTFSSSAGVDGVDSDVTPDSFGGASAGPGGLPPCPTAIWPDHPSVREQFEGGESAAYSGGLAVVPQDIHAMSAKETVKIGMGFSTIWAPFGRGDVVRFCHRGPRQAVSDTERSGGGSGMMLSGRSRSLPLWNNAPARTSATICGALTARQRAWAASISL